MGMASGEARVSDYDVCLSFAGEDREYVEAVANALRHMGIRVFYDDYERAELWGKDLYTHLDEIYRHSATYCVLFASEHYARKVWTNHERRSAQARAIKENREYILPARFDKTDIPGLPDTVGYISLDGIAPEELATLVRAKLGNRPRVNYFPPVPDRLFTKMKAKSCRAQDKVYAQAHGFFDCLKRMSPEERELVIKLLLYGCVAELPSNMHINIDFLRRCTGFTPAKIKRLSGGLRSIGFYCSLRQDDNSDELHDGSQFIVLEWHHLRVKFGGNATAVAHWMVVLAGSNYCETCAEDARQRLDFSQLATVTMASDNH